MLVGGPYLRVCDSVHVDGIGGARGVQFGRWVDPVGLAASLNKGNE